jgi:hypothetical protein
MDDAGSSNNHRRRFNMAIAPSMRELVQDIASSREDRAKAVKTMQQELRHLAGESRARMDAFRVARKLATGELRSELARSETDRSAEVTKIRREFADSRKKTARTLGKDLATGRAERDSAVDGMLTSLRKSREETAKALAKDLAVGRAERDSAVGEMLTGFRKSRKETARTLGKDLATGRAERNSAVAGMLTGFRKSREETAKTLGKDLAIGRAERDSAVGGMLTGFRNSREETAKTLGKDLARGRAERHSEVDAMRADSLGARAAVIGDIHEARAAWHNPTRVAKKSTVETAPGKAEGKAKEAPAAEEDSRDLEAKLLAAVNAHPEGITLAEVAESIGVAPIVFGRVSRKLLNEARIRKDDKLYFPVTGG